LRTEPKKAILFPLIALCVLIVIGNISEITSAIYDHATSSNPDQVASTPEDNNSPNNQVRSEKPSIKLAAKLTELLEAKKTMRPNELGAYLLGIAGNEVHWAAVISVLDSSTPIVFFSDTTDQNSSRWVSCWLSIEDEKTARKHGVNTKIEVSGIIPVLEPDQLPRLNDCKLGKVIAEP